MKVKLLRDTRIWHKAGEVVDASPAEVSFLVSVGSAEVVAESEAVEIPEQLPATAEVPDTPKKRGRKKN